MENRLNDFLMSRLSLPRSLCSGHYFDRSGSSAVPALPFEETTLASQSIASAPVQRLGICSMPPQICATSVGARGGTGSQPAMRLNALASSALEVAADIAWGRFHLKHLAESLPLQRAFYMVLNPAWLYEACIGV